MYFYIKQGKPALDLRSDFILTYDPSLISASSKKAAPRVVSNATWVKLIDLKFLGKISVCYRVFKFVMFHKPDPAAKEAAESIEEPKSAQTGGRRAFKKEG